MTVPIDYQELDMLAQELIQGYYNGEFEKRWKLLRKYVQFNHPTRSERDIRFLFLNALLLRAAPIGSDRYYEVLPVLQALLEQDQMVATGLKKTLYFFLANRILHRGQIPEFHVSSEDEFYTLVGDLEAALDVQIDVDKVFATVFYKARKYEEEIPAWVKENAQFDEFTTEMYTQFLHGQTIDEAQVPPGTRRKVEQLGFVIRPLTPQQKRELIESLEALDFEW